MFKPTPESDDKFRDMVRRLAEQPPDGYTNLHFLYNCAVQDAADILDDWKNQLLDEKIENWRYFGVGMTGIQKMKGFSKFIDKPLHLFRKKIKKYQKEGKLIPFYVGEYFDFDKPGQSNNMPQLVYTKFPKCIHRR